MVAIPNVQYSIGKAKSLFSKMVPNHKMYK